ncbi:MAG: LysR family transcriptional regulator [Lachnospiraceae bacterium]|nr:LysR family transcriptional regulator [Lachnospiraceae bacterium]
MDLKQLAYFVTVANEGTISAAARKLHMTQPPLSAQLKLLEEEAGCLLFERGPRSVRLTDAGKMVYEKASALLHMSSLLQEELKEYRRGGHGTLCLGIVSSVSGTLFCQWFKDFHQLHPDIRFELSEADTYQLLENLRDGLIELAIVRTPFPTGDFLSFPIKKEVITAAGHAHFFSAGQQIPCASSEISPRTVSLEELSHMPLILYRRWEGVLAGAFHRKNLPFEPFCKNDDARTTAFLADFGVGVGILPESATPLIQNPNTIWRNIEHEGLTSTISLIQNKNTALSVPARTFAEYLRTIAL